MPPAACALPQPRCPAEASLPAGFSPEEQLILLLARKTLSPRAQEHALALLAAPLRWEVLLARARAHKVYPLLYWNLQRLDFPGVPTQVRTALEGLYKGTALYATLLAEELARVLQLLHDAGIPAIPVKGVTLAASLYGDLTLRACGDMDVLVPREHVVQAFRLLLARGYQARLSEQLLTDVLLQERQLDIECDLVREERGTHYLLDLHWGVMWGGQGEKAAVADLWAEARTAVCLGVPAYALSPEWELFFLSAHAARHEWKGLAWLVDIHEMCLSRQLHWQTVTDKARTFGWEKILALTFSVCRTLLGTPLPPSVSVPDPPRWLTLFPSDPAPELWRSAVLRPHLMRARRGDRLRFLLRALFIPTAAELYLLRLPPSLRLLYCLLRPVRLGCKGGRELVRLLWRRNRGH
ncbi:MAG: nucleotidyltransferase family protein [Candidatus Binatia bacterium]|nr:nucleotidyltransferase family protein [Candidatus Binatia bacterium]